MDKMTARDFYEAVIALANVPADLSDYAKSAIAALDKKNADRKTSKAALARQAENDGLKAAILAALEGDDVVKVAADLAVELGVSTQKASALARQLAEDGTIDVVEVSIPKKGKVKGYKLFATEDITEDDDFDLEDSAEIAETEAV